MPEGRVGTGSFLRPGKRSRELERCRRGCNGPVGVLRERFETVNRLMDQCRRQLVCEKRYFDLMAAPGRSYRARGDTRRSAEQNAQRNDGLRGGRPAFIAPEHT